EGISKEKTCGERNRELKRNIFPKALPYFTCSSFSVTQNRPDYSPKHKTDFISLKFVESRSQISKFQFIPASFHRLKATLKSGTQEGSQHCVGDGFQLSVDHLDDQKFILFTQGNMDFGRRSVKKYNLINPKIDELKKLVSSIADPIGFRDRYGALISLLTLRMEEGLLQTLVQFYDPV
ncbi:hypothetical protein KIW84_021366, partial [Lathyrus oleraceus]